MRAVILAGGRGTRAGGGEGRHNKLLRRLPGEETGPLERQLRLLGAAAVPATVITGFDHRSVAPLARRYGAEVIFDGCHAGRSSAFALFCAARVFVAEETILLEGDLWIDVKTLETALQSTPNACLSDPEISTFDVQIAGRDGRVESLVFDPLHRGEPIDRTRVVARAQGIYRLAPSPQFAQFLEQRRDAPTYILALNDLIAAEGMQYIKNEGLWRNLNHPEEGKA